MKLYYFEYYAKAEPMRMMLTYAKIPFEDIRTGGDDWKAMKPTMEYGELPCLELDDGTKLVQSVPIHNYLSETFGLKPEGALEVYRGECLYEAICADFFWKLLPPAVFMDKSP